MDLQERKAGAQCGRSIAQQLIDAMQENKEWIFTPGQFPMNIWEEMGNQGLLGITMPDSIGGLGGNLIDIIETGEELTRRGMPVGVALSWAIHHCVTDRLLLAHGTDEHIREWLPELAKGKATISFAYGEKGAGVHAKNFATRAERVSGGYRLTGRKDFLTNGPIASGFVVFARTDQGDEKLQLTAFLVPQNTKGLKMGERLDVRNIAPSPHCTVFFDNCFIPDENRLGDEGEAFERMIRSWREWEEIYMMGFLSGALERQLNLLIQSLKRKNVAKTSLIQKETHKKMGQLWSLLNGMKTVSRVTAHSFGKATSDCAVESLDIASLVSAYSDWCDAFQAQADEMETYTRAPQMPEGKYLKAGIADLTGIGRRLKEIRQGKKGEWLIKNLDDVDDV